MKFLYSIHRYDVFLFLWLLNSKHRTLYTRVCRYLSMTGDGYLYLILCGVLLGSDTREAELLLACTVLGFIVERPLYFIAKNGFKRNRPAAALKNFHSHIVPADRFSFPSGHTSAAFMMASLCSAFYPPAAPWLYAWASLVGLSRVLLGVHFPTDVLVGAAMGTAIAQLCLKVLAP